MKKKYQICIGIAMTMLLVLTIPAAAENRAYFIPQHSNATTGNSTYITLYVDIDDGIQIAGGQVELIFNAAYMNITRFDKNCEQEDNFCWGTLNKNFEFTENGYFWGGCSVPQYWDDEAGEWISMRYLTGPAIVKIGRFKVEAIDTPGESPFNFGFEIYPEGCPLAMPCKFVDIKGMPLNITWENGTFTHIESGPSPSFTKELTEGWNLISLPLIPDDNSVDAVLAGVSQDAVKLYNATSKEFEDASIMDPGIGYFVHVTAADTWEYEGYQPVSPLTIDLKSGLNMIGVLNDSISISDVMESISYHYVARWNTTIEEFEIYNQIAPTTFHDFTTMGAGEGYFISAVSDGPLILNCP